MCFTDDDRLAESLRSIGVHGKGSHRYDNVRVGINGRLDTLQAAVLIAKFDLFQKEIQLRDVVANLYAELINASNQTMTGPLLTIPKAPTGYESVWAQYSLLAKDEEHRSVILKSLQENKIPAAIYYPIPLHRQTAFAQLDYGPGSFPISEDAAQRIFSLPMHPYLKVPVQEKIVQAIFKGH
jgi:dTDP-4-amino-4,6-dideoxygalactose transaminase